MENGINYIVSLEGQKTGFYADHCDNQILVHSLSNGRTILDVCCQSGGFALNAAFGGAVHVTGMDQFKPMAVHQFVQIFVMSVFQRFHFLF